MNIAPRVTERFHNRIWGRTELLGVFVGVAGWGELEKHWRRARENSDVQGGSPVVQPGAAGLKVCPLLFDTNTPFTTFIIAFVTCSFSGKGAQGREGGASWHLFHRGERHWVQEREFLLTLISGCTLRPGFTKRGTHVRDSLGPTPLRVAALATRAVNRSKRVRDWTGEETTARQKLKPEHKEQYFHIFCH